MEVDNLTKSVLEYIAKYSANSKNVFTRTNLTPKIIEKHRKRYAHILNDEIPLLAVNDTIFGTIGGYAWSGLIITNKKLHYKCIKDTVISGLIALSNKGSIPIDNIHSIAIGEHDCCFGTAYMGHQLIINGKVIGLLRMGGSTLFDEETINDLSHIFNALSKTKNKV